MALVVEEIAFSPTSTNVQASKVAKRQRELWTGKLDFVLSVMGYNIGLGNLLRFPYLCMKHGGAFLIPYFFFLLTIGVPMFLIELSLGQYTSKTPILFWEHICPILKGMGWCNVIACACFNVYYMIQLAWIMYYIVCSFINPLPWTSCDPKWASNLCYDNITNYQNNTVSNNTLNDTCMSYNLGRRTASEEFFEKKMLSISSGITDVGYVRWDLFLCLLVSWILVYLCLIRGVRSLGKVVYVTALGPYLLLFVLLIRGVTLEGGMSGIAYYLHTDWSKLATTEVWLQAGQQIFWSLAPAWGGTITMACHNKFSNNIYRDGVMLPLISSMTSFFGGFVTFSLMGEMARLTKMPIKCVMKSGPGMAFVVYPSAFTKMPIPNLWSFLFFLLLFFLGLDSAFTSFETMHSSLCDKYKIINQYNCQSKLIFCVISLLLGIPFITEGGHYVYQIIDWYQVAFMTGVAFIEVVAIAWIYGTNRLKRDIRLMTGVQMTIFWDIILKFVLPIILLVLTVITTVQYGAPTFGDYTYPQGIISFGWFFASLGFLPLPIMGVYVCAKKLKKKQAHTGDESFRQTLIELFKSTKDWEDHQKYSTNLEPNLLNRITSTQLVRLGDQSDIKLLTKNEEQ